MRTPQRHAGETEGDQKMSRYDQLAKKAQPEGDGKVWNRYGLSELEWSGLTIEQRLAHYRRQDVCEHRYTYAGIETDKGVFDLSDKRLEEQYSFDPYAHTAHMFPCRKKTDAECDCQMCAQKIGIWRG